MGGSTSLFEDVGASGDSPPACFGHTLTAIDDSKAILFGGAKGEIHEYMLTNEAYMFDAASRTWTQLSDSGKAPTPRAAHAATSLREMQLVIYGGAGKGTRKDALT